MNSQQIKQKVFEYYREKQAYLFSTENMWRFQPDCLIVYKDDLIEVEIKCSWSDFLNDFKKKKEKHECFANSRNIVVDYNTNGGLAAHTPNLFYFCSADLDLCHKIVNYLKDSWQTLNYGVMYAREINNCLIVKDAEYLHERPIHRRVLKDIQARMSSDYVKKIYACEAKAVEPKHDRFSNLSNFLKEAKEEHVSD